jgi:hypothetical protein
MARTHRIQSGDAMIVIDPQPVGIMMSAHFSQAWFEDALKEAKNVDSVHARRREIVFAVCLAETYLFEWVRDAVVTGDVQKLNQYFVPGKFRAVEDKWKEVPKELTASSLIPRSLDLGYAYWEQFRSVVAFRNGLVHAAASRPHSGDLPANEQAVPTMQALSDLSPGWALSAVVALIRKLHETVETTPPTWLHDP